MNLYDLLKQNKTSIMNLWIQKFTDTYPEESASFFRENRGQFTNPVGYTFRINLEKIFDELLKNTDQESIARLVDGVVRIRAVQGFAPSHAVCFVPMLRRSIVETCMNEIESSRLTHQWVDFLYRLEWLMNVAFDQYMGCREQLWKQKAEFMTSRTHKLLERANLLKKAVE